MINGSRSDLLKIINDLENEVDRLKYYENLINELRTDPVFQTIYNLFNKICKN